MQDRNPGLRRIQKRIVGQPITVGQRTIRPVMQIAGWIGGAGHEAGGGAGGWLRVTPVEVVVTEGDGTEYHVPVTDPTREALQKIVYSALLISSVCWLILLVLRRRSAG